MPDLLVRYDPQYFPESHLPALIPLLREGIARVTGCPIGQIGADAKPFSAYSEGYGELEPILLLHKGKDKKEFDPEEATEVMERVCVVYCKAAGLDDISIGLTVRIAELGSFRLSTQQTRADAAKAPEPPGLG